MRVRGGMGPQRAATTRATRPDHRVRYGRYTTWDHALGRPIVRPTNKPGEPGERLALYRRVPSPGGTACGLRVSWVSRHTHPCSGGPPLCDATALWILSEPRLCSGCLDMSHGCSGEGTEHRSDDEPQTLAQGAVHVPGSGVSHVLGHPRMSLARRTCCAALASDGTLTVSLVVEVSWGEPHVPFRTGLIV
jgi:hypothetical protein